MSTSTTVWVLEGDTAEAARALSEAGHRLVEPGGRGPRSRPQVLVADMAHLGRPGVERVRQAVAAYPALTPILLHVWEAHLDQGVLGAARSHLLLDPVSPDDLLEEVAEVVRSAPSADGGTRVIHADLPSIAELVQPLVAYVCNEARDAGLSDTLLATAVPLCVTESVINGVTHGNGEDASRRVRLEVRVSPRCFECIVTDEGEGFDPRTVPLPTLEENLLREHGRGLFLIRHYMDEVTFNDRGNRIAMVKRA